MKALRLVIILAAIFTIMAKAYAAPVDHVYVSSNKLDKLNLDGSLDMQFLPGSTDGICRQLAVNGNTGNIWLACESEIAGNNRVYLFDSNGNILHQCSDTPQFCAVVTLQGGMCIDPSGNAWITDKGTNQVYKYALNGTRAGPYPTGAGTQPIAVACDSLGNIWTANNSTNTISKLGNNGDLIATYSIPVAGNPRDIVIDQNNNVWVAGGQYISKFTQDGSSLGNFAASLSYKLAVDNAENIWVSRLDQITKFDNSGNAIGTFPITSPSYLAIDASGNIWINSGGANTVKMNNNGINLGTFPVSGNNGQLDTGFLYQKFVLGFNSVEGPSVWVPLNGGVSEGAITLTFYYINSKGNSSYTVSSTGTSAPTGFKLGTPPRYYGITSTATYTNNIEVCIGYIETEFANEAFLKLFHNSGTWTDITSFLDTTNNVICGDVTSLSEFAIMEPTGEGPIPTLSEWMLILMAAILFVVIVRRVKLSQKIA